MTLYRYKSTEHERECGSCSGTGFLLEQPWAADAILGCPWCGKRVYRAMGRVNFQFRHGMKGDMRDYREDLARFPNDPEAFVDGPTAVRKLLDKRKREGWVEGCGWDVLHDTDQGAAVKETPEGGRALIEECFEEAKQTNFAIDDWDVGGAEPEF